MKMKMKFQMVTRLPEFDRDFKRLLKKYPTLESDLDIFISTQLVSYHKLHIDNQGIVPIADLGCSDYDIYKAKKFACRSLKGKGVRSGVRVIYTYHAEVDEVVLIEIYSKSYKESEDRKRIKKYFKNE